MKQLRRKPILHVKNTKAKLHVGTKGIEVIVRVPIDKLLRVLRRRKH